MELTISDDLSEEITEKMIIFKIINPSVSIKDLNKLVEDLFKIFIRIELDDTTKQQTNNN